MAILPISVRDKTLTMQTIQDRALSFLGFPHGKRLISINVSRSVLAQERNSCSFQM